MAGIYLHIPFCKSRCVYCGFYSTTLHGLASDYVAALCREMQLRRPAAPARIDTVYLGGGTPSQLSPTLLRQLLYNIYKVYDVSPQAEVTMECNPDDVTADFAASVSELPVNRVSMGAQTFSDERLRFLHRRHTARQVALAVDHLRRNGIGNISVDLMFGFPGETLEQWRDDIAQVLALGVEHISAYSLMYEEGTPLYKWKQQQGLTDDDELSRAMYDTLIDRLTDAGFEHYEISNFARRGFRSRHNSSYWNATPYTGLGAAAHSYDLTTRSWNVADVRRYIDLLARDTLPTEGMETLDEATRYNDLVATALRTREGIDLDAAGPFRSYLMRNAQPSIDRQLLALTDNRLHLTRQGLFVSDDIMSDLVFV